MQPWASLQTDRPAPSNTKAQLLDVAEQLFLSEGLGVSVRDITDAAGQNGAAIHYHFGSRDGLIGAVIARRAGDLAARRRAALDALRRARRTPDHPRRDPRAGVRVRRPGRRRRSRRAALDRPDARAVARPVTRLAFMAEYAGEERDWERLARDAVPHLPQPVFDARLTLAIETVIVGLRTPSPTPGATVVKLPDVLHARAELLVDFVVAGLEGPI